MGSIAATLGLPVPFEFGGTTYQVSPCDLRMEGEFELWLESRALAAIERHAPRDDGREEPGRLKLGAYFQQQEGWRRDCAAGYYGFDGPVAAVSLATSDGPGRKHLVLLQLQRLTPGATPELLNKIWADPRAKQRLLDACARANADPTPGPSKEGEGEAPATPSASPS